MRDEEARRRHGEVRAEEARRRHGHVRAEEARRNGHVRAGEARTYASGKRHGATPRGRGTEMGAPERYGPTPRGRGTTPGRMSVPGGKKEVRARPRLETAILPIYEPRGRGTSGRAREERRRASGKRHDHRA